MSERERCEQAADHLRRHALPPPQLVMVLGSGLGELSGAMQEAGEMAVAEIPHWPRPAVEGHGASLAWGRIEGLQVACLRGRAHLYEGHSANDVVRPLRSLRLLGAERFLLTNAAGGIAAGMQGGDLMLIEDQINLTGTSPMLGPTEDALGPRFPDQSQLYDAKLQALLRRLDPSLKAGVYAGVLGPGYETPAEIRMLRASGASAVGMSTVLEVMALGAMGGRTAGISLISNLAAGLADQPLEHSQVLAAGRLGSSRLKELVRSFCRALANDD